MNMGTEWWTRMSNAVRFLEDAEDALCAGRSAVLIFPEDVPFREDLTDALRQRLAGYLDTRSFDEHNAREITDPGDFLLKNYCRKEERMDYRPAVHQSKERFLAQNALTPLHHRFVCLTDVPAAAVPRWAESISAYLNAFAEQHGTKPADLPAGDPADDHGIFILLTQSAAVHSGEQIVCLRYEDYISDYDCLMFCMILCSGMKISSRKKQYISEVANSIARNNVENAGRLVNLGTELALHPDSAAQILGENRNKTAFQDAVNAAVWEAQLKIIFPQLEQYRQSFTGKYKKKLQPLLPITNSAGERIDRPGELELGSLASLAGKHRFAAPEDYNRLCEMRDARNLLAHNNPIPFEKLVQLRLIT